MTKTNLSEEERGVLEQFVVPFFHLEKRFPLLPGKNDRAVEAGLIGLSESQVSAFRENMENNAKQAALELLKEEEIINLIDKLPFDGSETIVAFGDSSIEDDQGWFNILRYVLDISVENARFNFVNSGISYNTTTDALRRLDRDVLVHEPDWVFISLGTFDAQRLNIAPDRTLVPLSETWENLATVQQVITEEIENPLVWITPTPVITELQAEHALHDFTIDSRDLSSVTEIISGKTGGIVDPKAIRMGENEPKAWNYLGDGLHPSLSGHLNTAREVLRTLAEIGSKTRA
ncbi:MAG: SGNH/GDSL hydrolase family protein [Balneolales bacterium]|nr:SGNH/GDSL hydrolase family protein [Balneolales bacterium]